MRTFPTLKERKVKASGLRGLRYTAPPMKSALFRLHEVGKIREPSESHTGRKASPLHPTNQRTAREHGGK